jgi:ABC-type enterobactin transport system permease subunit
VPQSLVLVRLFHDGGGCGAELLPEFAWSVSTLSRFSAEMGELKTREQARIMRMWMRMPRVNETFIAGCALGIVDTMKLEEVTMGSDSRRRL